MAKDFQQSPRNKRAYESLAPEAAEIGTVPPQAVEIEEAVLGALMLESDSITIVQEYICSEWLKAVMRTTIMMTVFRIS